MRTLLTFVAAPLRGAIVFGWTVPRVSPGALIDRPSGTRKRFRGHVTGNTKVSVSRAESGTIKQGVFNPWGRDLKTL